MNHVSHTLEHDIYPILAPGLASLIRLLPISIQEDLTEIRLRVGKPLLLVLSNTDKMIARDGQIDVDPSKAYICSSDDIGRTLQSISRNSLYAYEQELRLGYITIHGGHRVGLAGQAVVDAGELKALKNISSLNIRIARQIKGCAEKLMPYIIAEKQAFNTLVISPPRCGKTTLLRDIVYQLSSGSKMFNYQGMQVGVVDERSEIAACRNGVPTVDLGPRVDVLDCCPKATGLLMLIRSMSPQVVVTDELGRHEDVIAVKEALNAGIRVIASVHGRDSAEILHRPYIGELIQNKYFDRYIILGSRPTIGTLEEIIAVKNGELLYSKRKGVKICG